MSFPNIPDITPYINITLEDAVNLLLTSIALEEMSLSKLMDAETCKILCVLNGCKSEGCEPHDRKHEECGSQQCKNESCILNNALLINKSVDNTMQNMIKMQMLLQFKLEKVKEIMPSTSTTTTTSSTTTTTTYTTTCSTSTCSTTTKRQCRCCLIGNGQGCVVNLCDKFNGQTAVLKSVVSCRDIMRRSIHYSVGNDDICLNFDASGDDIKIECPHSHSNYMILYGKGHVEKKSCCSSVIVDIVKFKLTVCKVKINHFWFKMEITSDTKPQLNHNSGIVQVADNCSTLRLEISC